MRVVKPERTNPLWTKEVECATCGAVVEITREDLSVKDCWDIEGKRDRIVATCCVCSDDIVVQDPTQQNWGDLPRAGSKKT